MVGLRVVSMLEKYHHNTFSIYSSGAMCSHSDCHICSINQNYIPVVYSCPVNFDAEYIFIMNYVTSLKYTEFIVLHPSPSHHPSVRCIRNVVTI